MTDEQFARLIGAIEAQNQFIVKAQDQQIKLLKKINTAVQIIALFVLFVILAAACSALGIG